MLYSVVFMSLLVVSSSSRANERFGGKPPSKILRFFVSKYHKNIPLSGRTYRDDFVKAFTYGLNVSLVEGKEAGVGFVKPDGNYTDILGVVQRKECDMAFTTARLDTLDGKYFEVGSVMTSGDIRAFTNSLSPHTRKVQLSDVFSSIDLLTYTFLISVIFIVSALLLFFAGSYNRKAVNTFEQVRIIGKCLATLVDQEDFALKSVSSRTVWVHFNFLVFITVSGYLTSLISVEQVASYPVKDINSLRDLISDDFGQVTPVIMRKGYILDILKKAPGGSDLDKLYDKVEQNTPSSILDFRSPQPHSQQSLISNFNYSKIALLSIEQAIRSIQAFTCLQLDFIESQHVSKEAITEGILTSFYSKAIDWELKRYVDYRMRMFHEFGLFGPQFDKFNEPVLSLVAGGEYKEGVCINIVRKYYDHDETARINYSAITFGAFRNFVKYLFVTYASISSFLPIEYLTYIMAKVLTPRFAPKPLFVKSPCYFKRLRAAPSPLKTLIR